jgi:hypothetical protein
MAPGWAVLEANASWMRDGLELTLVYEAMPQCELTVTVSCAVWVTPPPLALTVSG